MWSDDLLVAEENTLRKMARTALAKRNRAKKAQREAEQELREIEKTRQAIASAPSGSVVVGL